MKTPKLSVIVPVYNVEKYLDRCVRSLLNQTMCDIEVILVDDASPDNCPVLCDEYAKIDSRVKVIHKKNGGLGMACNSGIEVATGRYVAFCDSDDWVDEDMYRRMVAEADKRGAQIVYTGLKRTDGCGNFSIMSVSREYRFYDSRRDILGLAMDMIASSPAERIERRIAMSAKVAIYDRQLLYDNNIRFESERKFISEDLLFNLDCLIRSNRVVELPYAYYNYFVNTNSLTGVVRRDRFEKYKILREELMNRYEGVAEDLGLRVNRMFIGYVRDEVARIGRNKSLAMGEKREIIRPIVNDGIWRELRREYPVSLMPVAHRLYFEAVARKYMTLLIWGAKLKK